MQKYYIAILSLLLLLGVGSCHSKPDKVLDEEEMVDLLSDIYKSEAIIEMNQAKFKSESMKAVVRQSIFEKHGVTQEEFDSSMVWYGHNVRNYIKVYDGIIARLEDEEYYLNNADNPHKSNARRVKKKYPSSGDSADIWNKEHSWILLPQYRNNIIRFNIDAKSDNKKGDCYTFIYRMRNMISGVKVFMAVDYYDGTTSFAYRTSPIEGECRLSVQSDSTKSVKRLYGYLSTKPSIREAVFIDSIMMLRTRLDSATYVIFNNQKWTGPKRLNPEMLKKKAEEAKQRNESKQEDSIASMQNNATSRPRRFIPKQGLHKSNHSKAND